MAEAYNPPLPRAVADIASSGGKPGVSTFPLPPPQSTAVQSLPFVTWPRSGASGPDVPDAPYPGQAVALTFAPAPGPAPPAATPSPFPPPPNPSGKSVVGRTAAPCMTTAHGLLGPREPRCPWPTHSPLVKGSIIPPPRLLQPENPGFLLQELSGPAD